MSSERKSFLPSSIDVKIPVNFYPVVVGKICSVYGVLGWLKIVSFTEEVDDIMSYQPWFLKVFSNWQCLYLESWKKYRDGLYFIVKFKEIFDRDKAKLLSNHEIFVDILQFPRLCDGEYYWKDIIGFQVIGVFSYEFGIVTNLIETGSNDVLVVKRKDQKDIFNKIFLVPFIIGKVIKNINVVDRIISVDWDPKF